MKKGIFILLIISCFISPGFILSGQESISTDTLETDFITVADTLLQEDKPTGLADRLVETYKNTDISSIQRIDTANSIYYWRISKFTGERMPGNPDTLLTDFPNRRSAEGNSVSMSYLGNLGSPGESRIFSERKERGRFMFWDIYEPYRRSPDKYDFINTKIPYSNLTYQSAGSGQSKEERLLGKLSLNIGKSLNVGVDVNYLYARGYYQSQSVKQLDWVFFGSYLTDRHNLHVFINPADYTNAENGGLENDSSIVYPDLYGKRKPTEMPVNFIDTWNRLKSTQYYFTYRYNLGFERNTDRRDEEGNTVKQFVPVAGLIYTFDYKTHKRQFDSKDTISLNDIYKFTVSPLKERDNNITVKDSTSYWEWKNTVGLSLREGFSSWAKFDLTAFLTQDIRNYTLMDTTHLNDTTILNKKYRETSTYIGGELTKDSGKYFRYRVKALFGVIGDNLGDIDVSGNVETRIPLLGDTVSVEGFGHLKNLEATLYENHFRGRYFWWDNDFDKTRRLYLGGGIGFPKTKTTVKLAVENISNYIYFGPKGTPQQESGSIRVLTGTLEQNAKLGPLHWNTQLVYQTGDKEEVLPLPELNLYSNLYLQFKIAKVLTVQLGGNVHYFSKYHAPAYDPVIQQFRLQDPERENYVKIGNYPLINGYLNCHLKYTRFFIEFYNIGASFINQPAYFSAPHYPVNPMIFKMGLSWDFHN